MESWSGYLIFIAALGAMFFCSAVMVLVWALKHNQFRNLNQGARVIFDEEEPEGIHSDYFPGEAAKARKKLAKAREKKQPHATTKH